MIMKKITNVIMIIMITDVHQGVGNTFMLCVSLLAVDISNVQLQSIG